MDYTVAELVDGKTLSLEVMASRVDITQVHSSTLDRAVAPSRQVDHPISCLAQKLTYP